MPLFQNDWAPLLESEFVKPYFVQLSAFLQKEAQSFSIYPRQEDIFRALELTPLHETRVVILGQDPYHGTGQAQGLSFSVPQGVPIPPSLRNIFKERETDLGLPIPQNGSLVPWAQRGVLLLNTILTVRADTPQSHQGKGWETFTDRVVELLNHRGEPVVFLLWGQHAQKKRRLITESRHFVIESAHPSPLSAHRGFFGSRPFSRANRLLRESGRGEVNWSLD